ncbi:MAG: hypothetical protein M5U27_14065 [Gaiella sp.]|nr:hypothetical protein [Gaiella sp.]
MVLDRGRVDLVERDTYEDVEVRQDLAYARERRGANTQRVPIEPAGGELAERLGWRLVQGTERHPTLLLEHESVGVLLEQERSRAPSSVGSFPTGAVALAPIPQPVRLDVRHRYSNSLG